MSTCISLLWSFSIGLYVLWLYKIRVWVSLSKQAMLKQCTYALRIRVLTHRLFTSSGPEPLQILSHSQTLKNESSAAPHCAAPELGITVSPVWPLQQHGPALSGESEKLRGTQGTMAGHRESGRLPVMQKDWRDKDLPPSLTAAVNQANHSTPEFNAYDPKPSCVIQPLSPHTASICSMA